ncbi:MULTISPECIES: hypothetical protein [Nonomuraea]|uniref:Uncharacterized protein n=2 Tax=Nonomuraea TaxID=83681 RepID=A0A7W5VB91_9ACTN|nr:hypothetical protein [Nonomuraea dietziae]MBB3728434.1 hypothetical protein [Nonomuraea dietziae]
MAGLDVHFQALDECARAAKNASKALVPGDMMSPRKLPPLPGKLTDSTVFGRLDNSQSLAIDIDKIWRDVLGTDLGLARSKLGGVERALDKVETNIRAADKP